MLCLQEGDLFVGIFDFGRTIKKCNLEGLLER